jgi:hypothetical protein
MDLQARKMDVLEMCKMPPSVDIQQMENFIQSYMQPRVLYYKEKKRPPFIEDEFSEYFTAKCSGGTEIGGGSCAMDVKTKDNEGIDAMCVILNKKESNEKSLAQNFKEAGVNLDTLFNDRKDTEAVSLYIDIYMNKLQNVKKEKNLNDLYILAFISTKTEVFLVCFKVIIENIKYIKSGGFVPNKKGPKKIIVENFISSQHGNVRLYKSKKRMELRLLSDVIKSEFAVKIYTMPS